MSLPVLCADDFAMSDGITHAVEALAADGRLSATSALVTGPLWNSHRHRVPPLRESLAVGLHLTLTWGEPRTRMRAFGGKFPDLHTVITKALVGTLPTEEIAHEFQRQLDVFQDATGDAPAFIDGHEHVHALPMVRTALLTALARTGHPKPWIIRVPSDSLAAILVRPAPVKALAVAALSTGFARACRRHSHLTNDSFAGFSTFSASLDPEAQLRRAFLKPASRHLVMCHPSSPSHPQLANDPIAASRLCEFRAIAASPWLPCAIWRKTTASSSLWSS